MYISNCNCIHINIKPLVRNECAISMSLLRRARLGAILALLGSSMPPLTQAFASVLVTGGAGYIGSHTCVELIKAGETVRARS